MKIDLSTVIVPLIVAVSDIQTTVSIIAGIIAIVAAIVNVVWIIKNWNEKYNVY